MPVGPKRTNGRSLTDVVDDMLSEENYSDIAQIIRNANDKFLAILQDNERAAVREFLTTLMHGGFFINYRPEKAEISEAELRLGRVKWYDHTRGYGFIQPLKDDATPDIGAPDVYFSEKLLIKAGIIATIRDVKTVMIGPGHHVKYVPVTLEKGVNARFIRIVEPPPVLAAG